VSPDDAVYGLSQVIGRAGHIEDYELRSIAAALARRMRFLGRLPRHSIPSEADSNNDVETEADAAFRAFAHARLDREFYLKAYPDVAAAGVDPVEHWLDHGLIEGRVPFARGWVRRRAAVTRALGTEWQRHVWRGEAVAITEAPPISPVILSQIWDQARHDPGIFAVGSRAIPNLRCFDAIDLLGRDGADFQALLSGVPDAPSTVLVIPHLVVGGAETYACNLLDALLAVNKGPVLVIVTDQTAEESQGWEQLPHLALFRTVPLIFWNDFVDPGGHRRDIILACFVNALRPKRLIVINSRIGLDAVARFGRALSQTMQIVCAYFSMEIESLGAPFGCRFARHTWPFSCSLTDNSPMAEQLRALFGDLPGPGVTVLPSRVTPADNATFADRLEARHARSRSRSGPRRWLWISRVHLHKGTALLRDIANLCPNDQFDVFGPLDSSLVELGLILSNIAYRGFLPDLVDARFDDYDGFLFTSLFEGMPIVVLEMSQHAIPMVLAEVGGLRDTFDDGSVIFVQHRPTEPETAAAFVRALDQVAVMEPGQVLSMVQAARERVTARHGSAAYASQVADLFGLS
jgi:glycosyltransferase involved in cell wall biosynthesis